MHIHIYIFKHGAQVAAIMDFNIESESVSRNCSVSRSAGLLTVFASNAVSHVPSRGLQAYADNLNTDSDITCGRWGWNLHGSG